MTQPLDDARHLTFDTLDTLWNAGAPLVVPIQGEPQCRLALDPSGGSITLVTRYQTPEPDVANFKNVTFRAVADGDQELAELRVRVADNLHGAYGLIATIADELQVARSPLAAAVAAGIGRHRDVFASRGGLTMESEVGLFGELLFLDYLIRSIGAGPAIAAWQGPLSEEHDFVLDTVHLEIKTTVSERRRHVISGLSQLVPLRGIPLSLISIQLTRSAPDGGRTLPGFVDSIRRLAGGHVVPVDQRLQRLGWKAEDAELYSTYWTLRSQPRGYAVGGDFPAMTPDSIRPVVPNFGLVSDVSYRVDLSDLDFDSLPDPVAGFVESEES